MSGTGLREGESTTDGLVWRQGLPEGGGEQAETSGGEATAREPAQAGRWGAGAAGWSGTAVPQTRVTVMPPVHAEPWLAAEARPPAVGHRLPSIPCPHQGEA